MQNMCSSTVLFVRLSVSSRQLGLGGVLVIYRFWTIEVWGNWLFLLCTYLLLDPEFYSHCSRINFISRSFTKFLWKFLWLSLFFLWVTQICWIIRASLFHFYILSSQSIHLKASVQLLQLLSIMMDDKEVRRFLRSLELLVVLLIWDY